MLISLINWIMLFVTDLAKLVIVNFGITGFLYDYIYAPVNFILKWISLVLA